MMEYVYALALAILWVVMAGSAGILIWMSCKMIKNFIIENKKEIDWTIKQTKLYIAAAMTLSISTGLILLWNLLCVIF